MNNPLCSNGPLMVRDFALYDNEVYVGPDTPDGLDKDGFPGGDKRHNVWPTTFESAKQALLDFVPEKHRREFQDILYDVFMDLDFEESDEEE